MTTKSNNSVYYRLDGKTYKYNNPIELNKNKRYDIMTWVIDEDGIKSNEVYLQYDMKLPVPSGVKVSVGGGEYTEKQTVYLEQAEGLEIYYTLDGSIPTKESLVYSIPVEIDFGISCLKAISINKLGVQSELLEETYKVSYPNYGVSSKV